MVARAPRVCSTARLDSIGGGVSAARPGAGLPALTRGRARARTHESRRRGRRTPARRVSPPGRPPLACRGATIASRDLPPKATARGGGDGDVHGRAGGSFGRAGDDERDAVISRGPTGTARPRSGAAAGRARHACARAALPNPACSVLLQSTAASFGWLPLLRASPLEIAPLAGEMISDSYCYF